MLKSNVRFLMLALISAGTAINYLDRTVLGIAAPRLTVDLDLSPAMMGLVFSVFSWSYAAAQIPGGVLLDRFGTRLVYFAAVAIWSGLTLLQGFVSGLAGLLGCRLGLGFAEAPSYPANSRVVLSWFPQPERARANAVYAVGQYVGLAFLSPALFWIASAYGWRALFILSGGIGLGFSLIWLRLYRDPQDHGGVSPSELQHIRAGRQGQTTGQQAPFSWGALWRLLRHRQVLGASLGQFASNSTLVFFLTWFPTYLATERHIQFNTVGLLAMLPYIAASIGLFTGGWLSDWLLRSTGSATIARKLPVVAGLLMAATIALAGHVRSDAAVIAIMSFVFFGQGFCNLGWTLITDVAPIRYIGLTGGIFNLCANLAGVLTSLIIGVIVQLTGSFVGALVYVGGIAVLGVAAYVFVMGEVRRLELN